MKTSYLPCAPAPKRDNSDLIIEKVAVLETGIDDMNPELFTYLWEIIFDKGALDMFFTPIYMKKGRPGNLVTIICPPNKADDLSRIIFQETTSLGVRKRIEERICLSRKIIKVPTKYGEILIKIGNHPKGQNIAPEFEDCKNLAKLHCVSLKEVYQEALSVAQRLLNQ